MSDTKKRISINTDLFTPSSGKKNKTVKREKKEIKTPIKANSIKKQLIKKIKQKQQSVERQVEKKNIPEVKLGIDDNDFENDFMKSMHFLDTMIKEKQETKQKKRSLKRNKGDPQNGMSPQNTILPQNPTVPIIMNDPSTNVMIPQSTQAIPTNTIVPANTLILPEPKYGCLRNGSKPCYREYHNKTLKKYNPSLSIKKKPRKTKIRKRCIKKRHYHVGKTSKKGTVSVLIKNNQTRRRVQQDLTELKRKPLSEIKKELYKKNLLKIGSICPPDVIRTMYENTMLAGHINNSGKGVSLHNYMNDDND